EPNSIAPDLLFLLFFLLFSQHEAVIAGEFAGVISRPQDQIIRLRDDRKFLGSFAVRHAYSLCSELLYTTGFPFSPPSGRGKAVKQSRRKSPRRTKTEVVAPVRRHIEVTVGRTHERRLKGERAATQHTGMCTCDHWVVFEILSSFALFPYQI